MSFELSDAFLHCKLVYPTHYLLVFTDEHQKKSILWLKLISILTCQKLLSSR